MSLSIVKMQDVNSVIVTDGGDPWRIVFVWQHDHTIKTKSNEYVTVHKKKDIRKNSILQDLSRYLCYSKTVKPEIS